MSSLGCAPGPPRLSAVAPRPVFTVVRGSSPSSRSTPRKRIAPVPAVDLLSELPRTSCRVPEAEMVAHLLIEEGLQLVLGHAPTELADYSEKAVILVWRGRM